MTSNRRILGVWRTILCGSLGDLRVSVVKVCLSNFTTETQRLTETTPRNRFSNGVLAKFISFTDHEDHERSGGHRARWSSARLGRRPLGIYSRGQKYLLCLWIEGHR